MIRALLERLPEQDVESHLLTDEGEEVIDLVRHHWVVYWLPTLELVGVAALWLLALLGPIQLGWFFLVGGVVLALHAVYGLARERRDVFVVTNMRVFRASGVFSVRIATMPITRILDITVEKPLLGRILGFGRESADRSMAPGRENVMPPILGSTASGVPQCRQRPSNMCRSTAERVRRPDRCTTRWIVRSRSSGSPM